MLCVLLSILMPISSPAFVTTHANTSLTSFLSTYLTNATIANSTFIQISFRNNTYLLMNITPSKHMLINTTNGFSFVLNSISVSNILQPTLLALYYPSQSTLNELNTLVLSFIDSSATSLNQCVESTGTFLYECTPSTPEDVCLQNTCQRIPICGGTQKTPQSALYKFGIPSPFSNGVHNFSVDYYLLNKSYNLYFSTLSSINQSNIGSKIPIISSALKNISDISQRLVQNPLFPQDPSISISQFQTCTSYSQSNIPWWCTPIGFCDYVNFAHSYLTSAQSVINNLNASPLTNTNIKSYANAIVATTNLYVEPVIKELNSSTFNALLSAILPRYNGTVENVTLLLSRFQNQSLNQSLAGLKSAFAEIRAAGINQNITAAGLTMNSLLENLSIAYTQFNSLHMPVINEAFNTSMMIILKELNYQQLPVGLAQIALQARQISSELARQVNPAELSAIANSLAGINANITSYSGEASIPAFVKTVDAPFVGYLLSVSSLPISSKIDSGALYAALLSFIIGMALLVLFYVLTYHRLHRAKRIRHTKRARNAWRVLFAVIFVLVLAYTYETYVYANLATSFLPASGFFARAASSNTVVIAINTNSANVLNASVVNCAAALRNALTALNKSVQSMQLSNYTCVSSSASNSVAPNCYDAVLSSGTPTIQLNMNASSYITYRGLYGTVLQASGSPTYGGSCLLASLVKYALR